MKLRGKAKREFLERMAKGRRAAARRRNKGSPSKGARVGRGAPKRKSRTTTTRKARSRARPTTARRRRNPDLVTIANPSRAELARALTAYRRFHGVDPKKVTRGKGKGVLVALGELREIVYQPRRGQRRGPAFFHNFKPGNVLAVTADGKRLVIVDRRSRKAVDFDLGIIN